MKLKIHSESAKFICRQRQPHKCKSLTHLHLSVRTNISSTASATVSQLDKCLKSKSIRGDKNDCTPQKITPQKCHKFQTFIQLWYYRAVKYHTCVGLNNYVTLLGLYSLEIYRACFPLTLNSSINPVLPGLLKTHWTWYFVPLPPNSLVFDTKDSKYGILNLPGIIF